MAIQGTIRSTVRGTFRVWLQGLRLARGRTGTGKGRLARLRAVVKRAQYARMVQALDSLPSDQLAEIGIRRQDIPARARWLIYEHG